MHARPGRRRFRARGDGPRGRRGAVLVELAVILPFFLFILVAATDYARVFRNLVIVQDRARSAALSASLDVGTVDLPTSDADWTQATIAAARYDQADLALPLTPQVSPPALSSITGTGASVAVTVASPFQTITNFPGIPGQFTVSRTVTMRLQPTKFRMK